nr:hypothetical protein [Candidatus Bathyarchaeota archaeon]
MLRKAVITAAGLGTRLLSATKEMPKEMLPLFSTDANNKIMLKPVLQLIFEQLYDAGFREFCFVVGRGKRSVEDHFTPDHSYVELLRKKGKTELADRLEDFYSKVESSTIFWVNQPEPRGFGDAVLKAEPFVGEEPFLVQAGDTYIVSKGNAYLTRLIDYYLSERPAAVLTLRKVHRLQKDYGYAVVEEEGEALKVKLVVEKPETPPSDLAIMPVYVFDAEMFEALKQIRPGVGNEVQLTDAIQKLVEWGKLVGAIKLEDDEIRLDVGTPETYSEALKLSYELSLKGLL